MKKLTVFLISLIGTLLLVRVYFLEIGSFCYPKEWCDKIFDLVRWFDFNIFIFPITLFFSIITYKMKDEIFIYWLRFIFWYIPLYIIFVFITRSFIKVGGGFGSLVSNGLNVLSLLFFLAIFFITSLVLIIKKYFALKK